LLFTQKPVWQSDFWLQTEPTLPLEQILLTHFKPVWHLLSALHAPPSGLFFKNKYQPPNPKAAKTIMVTITQITFFIFLLNYFFIFF
jgi:hypothetical protein